MLLRSPIESLALLPCLCVCLSAFTPAAPAQTILAHMPGGVNQSSGDSSTGIGDITGNGLSEIVIGSPTAALGGRIMIFTDQGDYIREMWLFGGTTQILEMGRSVDGGDALSGAGDVNNDGVGDVAVGAPGSYLRGTDSGAMVVFNGRGGAIPLLEIHGARSGERFGTDVAMVGAVDGDANSDVLVGAPAASPPYAEVYSGANGAMLLRLAGLQADDAFGTVVTGVGDLDRDGRTDLLIGAPKFDDGSRSDAGVARLFSGRTGFELGQFRGASAEERFGSAVASAGDVNGDGYNDFLIGGDGVARVFSGKDGSLLHELHGSNGFGLALSGVGDQDGDGRSDFVVGAPYADALNRDAGTATLYSGDDAWPLYVYMGHVRDEKLGEEISIAGDTNGDGWTDFLIGAIGEQKTLLCTYRNRLTIMSPPSPGRAGEINTVQVAGARPGWEVTLEYAYETALRPIIESDGLHLDIASYPFDPVIKRADASGSVVFAGIVSSDLAGRTLLIQAHMKPPPSDPPDTDPCSVSAVMSYTFD
ncbi:MAG: hypothetical protein EYC70_02890 [Planctomycetota bacterium]|nr:MAG: hypothetical protein EYC70_02890 [Planctomycetota bacterium]